MFSRRFFPILAAPAIALTLFAASPAGADTVGATPQMQRTADGQLTIPIDRLGGTYRGAPVVPAAASASANDPTTIYNTYVFPGGDDARRNYAPSSGATCVSTRAASATEAGSAIPQLGQAQQSQTVVAVPVDELGNGQSVVTNVREATTQQRFAQSCARPGSS